MLEKWELKLLHYLGGFWKVLLPALQHARWLLNNAADFILGGLGTVVFWSVFAEVKDPTVVFVPSLRSPHAFGQWLYIREDLILKKKKERKIDGSPGEQLMD